VLRFTLYGPIPQRHLEPCCFYAPNYSCPKNTEQEKTIIISSILGALILLCGGILAYTHFHHRAIATPIETAFNSNDLTGALTQVNAGTRLTPSDAALLAQKASSLQQQGSLSFKEGELGGQAVIAAKAAVAADGTSAEHIAHSVCVRDSAAVC